MSEIRLKPLPYIIQISSLVLFFQKWSKMGPKIRFLDQNWAQNRQIRPKNGLFGPIFQNFRKNKTKLAIWMV